MARDSPPSPAFTAQKVVTFGKLQPVGLIGSVTLGLVRHVPERPRRKPFFCRLDRNAGRGAELCEALARDARPADADAAGSVSRRKFPAKIHCTAGTKFRDTFVSEVATTWMQLIALVTS